MLNKIVLSLLRTYWRATRGMTLAAEGCLIDADGRVALVKYGSHERWRLPRTEVRRGESLADAVRRLLEGECGVDIGSEPTLHWLYRAPSEANGQAGHGQAGSCQTGLCLVRHWRQSGSPARGDVAFFALDALPADLGAQDAARIRQAVEGRTPFEVC